jgi:hypothetical protein
MIHVKSSFRCAFLLVLTIVLAKPTYGQYTSIGPVTFASNTYGPMVCRTDSNSAYSRHAYIYPATTLGNLAHGDSIRMIEFFKTNAAVYAGNPVFKMYLAMSDSADFGNGNIKSWSTEVAKSGVQNVFDGSIQSIVDVSVGYKEFHFDTIFVFDTTQGSHLKIFVEFYQNVRQTVGQFPFWAYENDISVPAFISNDETKYVFGFNQPLDSTLYTQVRKPSIRIHFPRHDVNAAVNNVYALGELALLMPPVDTIKFIVRNTGKKPLYNHPFEISVRGANTFRDTVYVDTLDIFSSKMLFSSNYKPKNKGVDSLIVRSVGDVYTLDDSTLFRRNISYNVLSHNNPFVANAPFGIGFNGSSGDFIAKYYTDSNYINQIKIGFATSGQPFKLGIWQEDASGQPGKVIYTSDTLMSNGSTYIQPVLPKVQVRDGYFVGIQQLGTQNIAFQYEAESPVRPGVFYFTAPTGDTNWTPFSPGFDFNFDIQPRIQVAHDVAVIAVSLPADLDTFEFNVNDSFHPKAIVYNYGVNDQNNPFDVVCEARDQFNKVVYRAVEIITIDAEDSLEVTFQKPFWLSNYGDLRMSVYTKLSGDEAPENDTIGVGFSIYVQYDIQVESFFEPTTGSRYELNKDRVGPIVRMVNFGSRDQTNIKVTSRIIQDTSVAQVQTITIDLAGGGSQILAFDSVTIPFAGDVYFEVFCWNAIDSFPVNDTARVLVNVVRSNDLGIVSIIRPRDSSIYERNVVFRPYLNYRNFGLGDQDSIVLTAAISQENGNVIYTDTLIHSLTKFSSFQALFKEFKAPDSAQTLYFDAKTWIDEDQDTTNDKANSIFFIKTKTDLSLTKIDRPVNDSLYLIGDTITPRVFLRNVGNSVIPTTARIFCEISRSDNSIVFKDSIELTNQLTVNETDTMDFAYYVPTAKDDYKTLFYVDYANDGEANNDTLSNRFTASLRHSVRVTQIVSPIINEVYQLNQDVVRPSFSVGNIGTSDLLNPILCAVSIKTNGNEVYAWSDSIKELASEAVININTSQFRPNVTGAYTMTVTISNSDDQLLSDNEMDVTFFVSLQNDIAPITFTYPEQDSLVFANRTYAPIGTFKNLGDSAQDQEFSVSYLIDFDGANRYNSNKNITLDSGEVRNVVFDSTFTPTLPGIYQMMLVGRLGTDQVLSNDTLLGSFVVDYHSSLERIESLGLEVYPIPTSGNLHVDSKNTRISYLNLYDAAGKLVYNGGLLNAQQSEIDVTSYKSGFYWLEIKVENESVWKKIIIE